MRRSYLALVGICLCSGLILGSCKTRPTTSSHIKHKFGRTYIRPEKSLLSCQDGKNYPESVAYLKSLASRMMAKNEATFSYEYAPEKFCFEVVDVPGLNASADPETRKIRIRADLLRFGVEGDAPIAAVIAHELAHITMQHRRREPVAEDMPKDLDMKELNRRIEAQKVWKSKIESSRATLVNDAFKTKFLETADKVIADKSFWRRIAPALGKYDQAAYKKTSDDLMKLGEEYEAELANPTADAFRTWKLLDMITYNLDEIASSAPQFSKFIQADPIDCAAASLCDESKTLQFLTKYINDKIKPSMDETCALKIDPKDDPQNYAPWVQWMEQQADEVGFEFFLRAEFSPSSYTTFVETMMKADERYHTCLENLKLPGWKAPRITDEFLDGHPPFCFRYANINVEEMLSHEADYAPLLPKATIITLPELSQLRDAAIKSLPPKL